MHIGHIRSTYLPADIYTRFLKAIGEEAIYVCATDEHGSPIEINAQKEGIGPLDFVKKFREIDAIDFNDLNIKFDTFYHTHGDLNRKFSLHFFNKLQENNYIEKKKTSSTYCASCNRYLPDRYLRGICPHCDAEDQYGDGCEVCGKVYDTTDLKSPRCAICNSPASIKETEHFFFKLSELSDFLNKWISESKSLQEDAKGYALNWIRDGLKDWDITRDGPIFGFEIPDASQKYLYVWFDAPIGYVSSTAKWAEIVKDTWERFWKDKDCKIIHFIGKDIIYHHYLFWPAMLYGIKDDFNLPYMIPVRGFSTLEKRKMSKSKGHLIEVRKFLDIFPADYLRFYLAATTSDSIKDGDFSIDEFKEKINTNLIGALGNFVNRILTFTAKNFNQEVPSGSKDSPFFKEIYNKFKENIEKIKNTLSKIEIKKGLEQFMDVIHWCNRYINNNEPWKKIKTNKKEVGDLFFSLLNVVRIIAVLSYPYLPNTALQIFQLLNLDELPEKVKWDTLFDFELKPGHKLNNPKILFNKINNEHEKLLEK
ncbi:MAG: methionine--tRNA ligase [Promethearchaeota archaeon]